MQTRLLGLALLALACGARPLVSAQGEEPARPNLVFIYTDDQGAWTVGAAGNADAHTPNIDRIYREGCHLPNAFVSTPVCSPARASLMTSRYPSELGIPDYIIPQKEDWLGLDPSLPTWPRLLRSAGYRTALIGKWHLGRTREEHHPTNYGYEHFMGHRAGGWAAQDPTLEKDGKQQRFEGLTEDILATEAMAFIAAHKSEPFALSLHFRAPHTAWLPVGPEDDDKHHKTFPEFELLHKDIPGLDEAHVQRDLRDYYSSVTCVDRNVGRVLDQLDELGLAENTIVVFTSDHGYNVGQYGLWSKGNAQKRYIPAVERVYPNIPPKQRPNLYDTSLRVPCAVRWPAGIEAGSKVRETVDNLDWFPTLCELTETELPERTVLHGSSFATLLRGGDMEDWDDSLYCEWDMRQGAYVHMRALRTPDWKYVIDFLNEDAAGRQRGELYDLKADPEERENLYGSAEVADVQVELHKRLCQRIVDIGKLQMMRRPAISINFISEFRYGLMPPTLSSSPWGGIGFWNNVGEPLGKKGVSLWSDLFDSRGHATTADVRIEGATWYRSESGELPLTDGIAVEASSGIQLGGETRILVTAVPDALLAEGYMVIIHWADKDRPGEFVVTAEGKELQRESTYGAYLVGAQFEIRGSGRVQGIQLLPRL